VILRKTIRTRSNIKAVGSKKTTMPMMIQSTVIDAKRRDILPGIAPTRRERLHMCSSQVSTEESNSLDDLWPYDEESELQNEISLCTYAKQEARCMTSHVN